jgi:IS66 C-terminal element
LKIPGNIAVAETTAVEKCRAIESTLVGRRRDTVRDASIISMRGYFLLRNHFHNRKNWNFCWTELGAKHVGIVQSLIVTCRLHGIDVYTYLVDVLQRVSQHPASRVAELTPRFWKANFSREPLRSDLYTTARHLTPN